VGKYFLGEHYREARKGENASGNTAMWGPSGIYRKFENIRGNLIYSKKE